MSRVTNPKREAAIERASKRVERGQSMRQASDAESVPYSTLRARLKLGQHGVHELPPEGDQPSHHAGEVKVDSETGEEIPVFVRDYSAQPFHRPYPLGDLHIGSPGFAAKAAAEWFGYLLAEPNTSLLNTGDNTNCALRDAVSDTYTETMSVKEARREQTRIFKPLAEADKIDAIIDGNHELRVYKRTGDSPNAAVADALEINYAMSACIVRYLVGDQSYDCYLRHGKGGGATYGAAVNRLARQETIIDSDFYVSGHTHTQVAFPKNVFVPNGKGGFRRKKRLFVCSGSFLLYEDYAAEAGYAPAHIGAPRIFLDGRRDDMHASV